MSYGYKDYIHATRRLLAAGFEITRTAKGRNRDLGQATFAIPQNHHPIIYTNLLTSCKLTAYLADIDKQAEDMFFLLVNQLAEKEGVTEQLKADNQMLWVARMNNIRNRAEEIVYQEIIYT